MTTYKISLWSVEMCIGAYGQIYAQYKNKQNT
jgi:hypothetical protein